MERKPLLRVAGPAWELARFFLFIAFLAAPSSSSGNADMLSEPWLLAAGAGGLAMPAAFLLFALAPDRYASYLPLLRLGKVFEVATVALLFATGTILWESTMPMPLFRVPVLYRTAVAFGLVILADLVVLAGLFRVRAAAGTPSSCERRPPRERPTGPLCRGGAPVGRGAFGIHGGRPAGVLRLGLGFRHRAPRRTARDHADGEEPVG